MLSLQGVPFNASVIGGIVVAAEPLLVCIELSAILCYIEAHAK